MGRGKWALAKKGALRREREVGVGLGYYEALRLVGKEWRREALRLEKEVGGGPAITKRFGLAGGSF